MKISCSSSCCAPDLKEYCAPAYCLLLACIPPPVHVVAGVTHSRCSLLATPQVLPGGKIPTDGMVIEGQSLVNEAMITGEPEPVWKQKGDAVIGGTISTSNMLLLQATRVGSETTLSQIVKLVEHAQLSKAPVQAFADRVAAVFVPIVVCLSIITWLGW